MIFQAIRTIKNSIWRLIHLHEWSAFLANNSRILSPKSYVDVPARLWNIRPSLYLFVASFSTHQYTNFLEKEPNFAQPNWALLRWWFPPYAPNSVLSSVIKKTPIAVPKFAKEHPKRLAHYTYTHDVRSWSHCTWLFIHQNYMKSCMPSVLQDCPRT